MRTVYIGNALTNVPDDFLKLISDLKYMLREVGWDVLEYIGTTNGTCRDVWKCDMHDCVGGCDVLLAVADYPSTGLGIEIGLMIGRHRGPVLIVAQADRVAQTSPRLVTRAVQDPDEQLVKFLTYKHVADIPTLLESFCFDLGLLGHRFKNAQLRE